MRLDCVRQFFFHFHQLLYPSVDLVRVSLNALRFLMPKQSTWGQDLFDVVGDAIRIGVEVDVISYVENVKQTRTTRPFRSYLQRCWHFKPFWIISYHLPNFVVLETITHFDVILLPCGFEHIKIIHTTLFLQRKFVVDHIKLGAPMTN